MVDYFLASHELIPSISSLRVLEFSAISDHAPLLCTLNAPAISNLFNNHESVVVSDIKLGLKWNKENNESKGKYIAGLRQPCITAILEQIRARTCNGHQDVFEINTNLTKTIQDVASSILTRKKTNNKKHHNNNVWFDLECRKSKRKTNKFAKKHTTRYQTRKIETTILPKGKLTVLSSNGRKGNSLPPSIAISIKKEILIGRASKS